ncbi:MAG: D-aminoacyl-tRNA deacylase [Gammaproteobacteria bacterium]|nr:D-aminoacyl-tRNA deacylase [Gammaproteobacteria bacterium]
MIGLVQRVTEARVEVDNRTVAQIDRGILALIGVEKQDESATAQRLAQRIIQYRIFPDLEGKMNLSLQDTGGELLLVPQFTLPADTRKGNRPSFSSAAPPETGQRLFLELADCAREAQITVKTGVFGANMQVSLTNDGPVTFWLQV